MRALLLGLVAAFSICMTASAMAEPEETKPDIEIKMKQGDITVTLDDTIKANAPLAANLLAEGKSWAEKQRTEAQAALKANPRLFNKDMPWSYERNYVAEAVVGPYVSIVYN